MSDVNLLLLLLINKRYWQNNVMQIQSYPQSIYSFIPLTHDYSEESNTQGICILEIGCPNKEEYR